MVAMSWPTFWRAGLLQAASVAVVAVILAVTLPHSFFEDWGWLAGPGAWAACALLVARVLRLPPVGVLLGAALAGLPAIVGVLTGAHWVGTALGLPIFALWCARLRRDEDLPAEVV
jgi:hypothetical protein